MRLTSTWTRSLKEPRGLKERGMQRWIRTGEQDGGGRVSVSMSRMTVARGSVSMSRRVPYHDRLCAREVRLQGGAESAAQPTNVWGSQSVGGRSMGPLRATTTTGLSRDRVIVVQGCASSSPIMFDETFGRMVNCQSDFLRRILSS